MWHKGECLQEKQSDVWFLRFTWAGCDQVTQNSALKKKWCSLHIPPLCFLSYFCFHSSRDSVSNYKLHPTLLSWFVSCCAQRWKIRQPCYWKSNSLFIVICSDTNLPWPSVCRKYNIVHFKSPYSIPTAIIISHKFYPQLHEHQLNHYKRGIWWKNEDHFHSRRMVLSFSVLPCSFWG